LRIIAADSSTAVLNKRFEPISIVASAAVLVNPPYRESDDCIAEPIFADAEKGHEVILHEAELCRRLLERENADCVHLDMSLGAVSLEQLSPIQFSSLRITAKAKRHLIKILPKLRKIAGEVTLKHGVEVLAIGKQSIPVRIAELTAGAHAILYACDKALEKQETILLGLPSKCQARVTSENQVYLHSLITAEHDVRGSAEDSREILKRVHTTEILNPIVRGFRALKITPRFQSDST